MGLEPGAESLGRLFDALDTDASGALSRAELAEMLQRSGLTADDPRVHDELLGIIGDGGSLSKDEFVALCSHSGLVTRAIKGQLVIPDFPAMVADVDEIYYGLLGDKRGAVADYIPQLARVSPDQFAVSICTVDGQRHAIGDAAVPFCIQSVSKPITYCLALEEHGVDKVHKHVGREPSGRGFNELSLNNDGLPHNPMINAGAVMSCSLIRPDLDMADRFDHITNAWKRLSGGGPIGFNNAVYLSERETADRNFALGYFMREKNAFPPKTDLHATLEFYFQCCSIETNSDALAMVAASLANGGLTPTTNDRVLSQETVQHCMSLMSSCGMYDYSGEFAFTIGLPAKSGVSGALMVVVPQVMGIAVWSPRLDAQGNTVRGIEFCKQLVSRYNFHAYDGMISEQNSHKRDPRLHRSEREITQQAQLCWAASRGDADQVSALLAAGADPNGVNFDDRTALHLAAGGGHGNIVSQLLRFGADAEAVDRWGSTPRAYAERAEHVDVAALLPDRQKATAR